MLDTGFKLDHEDLAAKYVTGYDFVSDAGGLGDGDGIDADPTDPGNEFDISLSSWHGTHVAGTIAASSDNGVGVAGVSWGAKVMPLRVIGDEFGSTYDILQGLLYAAGLPNDSGSVPAQRADIINLSLGGGNSAPAMADLVEQLYGMGIIVIAAAGNDENSHLNYPASYPSVVSVSATDINDDIAIYSSYGCRVDLAAPGGTDDGLNDVWSTFVDIALGNNLEDGYQQVNGTSMAAPHVSGVAALMKAVNPQLTAADFGYMLRAGMLTIDMGAQGWDDGYGYGFIDAQLAVSSALNVSQGATLPQISNFDHCLAHVRLSDLYPHADVDVARITPVSVVASIDVSEPWLRVRKRNTDSTGYGLYRFELQNTDDLIEGLHTAYVRYIGSEGYDLEYLVRYNKTNATGSLNIEPPNVYLYDENNHQVEVDRQRSVWTDSGEIRYTFEGVKNGRYSLRAMSDLDQDGVNLSNGDCLATELCGEYVNESGLNSLMVSPGGNIGGVNIEVH